MKVIVHAPTVEEPRRLSLCYLDIRAAGRSQAHQILGAKPLIRKRLKEFGIRAKVSGNEKIGIRIHYPATMPYETWYVRALDALQEYTKSLPDAHSRNHRSLEIVSGLTHYNPR